MTSLSVPLADITEPDPIMALGKRNKIDTLEFERKL